MEYIFFYAGLSFLTAHEIDAVRCREWRIIPGLSMLHDKEGQISFILAHIPVFLIILFLLKHSSELVIIKSIDMFMIVHVGLHLIYIRHKSNEFKDWISWVLIVGAGVLGFIDFMI